jgi:hypothetical protein
LFEIFAFSHIQNFVVKLLELRKTSEIHGLQTGISGQEKNTRKRTCNRNAMLETTVSFDTHEFLLKLDSAVRANSSLSVVKNGNFDDFLADAYSIRAVIVKNIQV